MNKNDKIILVFYIILGISFFISVVYLDQIIPPPLKIETANEITKTIESSRIVDLNKTRIFQVMTDVKNYPIILPTNVISVKIINQTENIIFAEEEIVIRGLKEKTILKHTIEFPNTYIIEIMHGEAKGTKITVDFEDYNSNSTMIKTKTELVVQGILKFIAQVKPQIYVDELNSFIDQAVSYSRGFDDETSKIIDDIYLEILFRHADPQGLQHYKTLLEEEKITIDEIKEQLLQSDEKKHVISPNDLRGISELKDETRKTINDLYQEVLYREVDIIGLQYYGSLLEASKITTDEIKEQLLQSDEKRHTVEPGERKTIYELKDETRKTINDLYQEVLYRSADSSGLEYYGSLLEAGKITIDEIRQKLLESPERALNPNLKEERLGTSKEK
ncbi:MAG: DUF4214 domain-containing protein [Nitrosarchaeum sp.]|nr:DUF4214 domain-containing protein [Nitrosarchaeum sp.]